MKSALLQTIKKMNSEVKIIRSQEDACAFLFFARDIQLEGFQGHELEHTGGVIYFRNEIKPDTGGQQAYLDFNWVWNNRREINDFLNRLNSEYREYCQEKETQEIIARVPGFQEYVSTTNGKDSAGFMRRFYSVDSEAKKGYCLYSFKSGKEAFQFEVISLRKLPADSIIDVRYYPEHNGNTGVVFLLNSKNDLFILAYKLIRANGE